MPEMPRNEHAEDENRHHDERNRDEQGLGIGSEYQPPTKQEPIIPFPSFVDSLLRLRHGRRRRRSSGQCHCPISDRPPNRVVRARRNRRAHAEREIRSRGGGIEWEGRWAEARRGEA
ncbi:Os05g0436950, partial [Oryza sativa Japonica Group]